MPRRTDWLEQLSRNEISLEEARRRLDDEDNEDVVGNEVKPSVKTQSGKTIKILIESSDNDRVKVQVPMAFARFLLKFNPKIMSKTSFNDSDFDVKEIVEMLEEGLVGELVDIESSDGDRVKVVVE